MPYILAILLCIAADQAVKYYVVTHLALYESAPLLPGIVELLHIQNTGGGFSILSGHTPWPWGRWLPSWAAGWGT